MSAVTVDTPFLEAVHDQPPQEPTGLRFFEDGRMEIYGARPLGGAVRTPGVEQGSGRWQPVTKMTPERVRALMKVIREGGFFDLPEVIEAGGHVSEGGIWTWTARVDGREHQVALIGTPYARSDVIDHLFIEAQAIPFRP